jgi:DNA-binding MarR family transcriptional regulator
MIAEDDVTRLRTALGRIARRVDRQVTGDGMTRSQLSVLGTIARARTLRMSELADTEGVNPTMLSRIVGKLADGGLISRTPDPDDLRSITVSALDAGRAVHERIKAQRAEAVSKAAQALPHRELTALIRALDALEHLADELSGST